MNLPYSRVLITGCTGFIGARLATALIKKGIDVHGLGLPGGKGGNLLNEGRMHEGTITDKPFIASLMKEVKPEVVFHLAAYGTFGHEKDVQRMIEVNIGGTKNILDASIDAGVTAFVMAASAKEYATGRVPHVEEERLSPWDDYAATKAAAEYFCQLFAWRNHISTTALRLSPVYGPGDSVSRFIPVAIASALSGKPFTISSGALVRNFTYIDDVVDAFIQASLRTGSEYEACNIASPGTYSFEDVLSAVEDATGKAITRVQSERQSLTDDSWLLRADKARDLLGWEAKISLREGVDRTVKWYTETQL